MLPNSVIDARTGSFEPVKPGYDLRIKNMYMEQAHRMTFIRAWNETQCKISSINRGAIDEKLACRTFSNATQSQYMDIMPEWLPGVCDMDDSYNSSQHFQSNTKLLHNRCQTLWNAQISETITLPLPSMPEARPTDAGCLWLPSD